MAEPDGVAVVAAAAPMIDVSVVYAPAARVCFERQLRLPATTTLAQAIAVSGLWQAYPELQASRPALGVWGHPAEPAQLLRDMDRIEIYRELTVDPKVARRERFRKQGVRSAGLFAKTRPPASGGF